MAHVTKTSFSGNPNVGLYVYADDNICLLGTRINTAEQTKIKNTLDVPVHKISLCGTSMIGVFAVGNKNCILIPSIVFEEELKKLDKLKINYKILDTHLTALGNNILCNDDGCIVNPEFADETIKEIKAALKVPVKKGTIADLGTVGSLAILNGANGLAHPDITKTEKQKIEKLLNVKLQLGTINFGVPFVRSGIIANKNGFIVGSSSTGVEIQNVDIALGYIEG